jgi:hypothetical protein
MALSPIDTTLAQVDQGINAAASIAATVPGVGTLIAGVLKIGEAVVNAIGIRSGADEADVITKVQTPLGNQLVAINAAIPYASVTQLTTMYQAVGQLGSEFQAFVANPVFVDGRASTQALNTIMPLINGTGGYTSKNSGPGCSHCGPAGGGEDGIEGSILRQIQTLNGGSPVIMAPSAPTQGIQAGIYMSLDSPSTTYGDGIPQAGTLPLYPPVPGNPAAPQVVSVGLSADATPLLIGAALLFLIFRKRG